MSWDDAKRLKERSGGKFISLKDGDRVTGVFRGEPHCFYKKYGDKNEYFQWAEGRSTRFKIVFMVDEGGSWEARIFENGYHFLASLIDCKEKYGLDCVFEIKRTGTGTDTRYSILFDRKLTDEELDVIKKLTLPGLTSGRARAEDDGPPPPTDDDHYEPEPPVDAEQEDIPF